jgi:hypothetical protein
MEIAQDLLQATQLSKSILVTPDLVASNCFFHVRSLSQIELHFGGAPSQAIHRKITSRGVSEGQANTLGYNAYMI